MIFFSRDAIWRIFKIYDEIASLEVGGLAAIGKYGGSGYYALIVSMAAAAATIVCLLFKDKKAIKDRQ